MLARDFERGLIFPVHNQFLEARGARDVCTFADICEAGDIVKAQWLEAGKNTIRRRVGYRSGGLVGDGVRDGRDMFRSRAAATAGDVEESAFSKFADTFRHGFWRIIISAILIRQTSVRIDANRNVGERRDILNVGPQVLRAEGTIEPHAERMCMAYRCPKCRGCLAGQGPPGCIRDRAGDHHGKTIADFMKVTFRRIDRRFAVQRIKNCFDQQYVGAAFIETDDRFFV